MKRVMTLTLVWESVEGRVSEELYYVHSHLYNIYNTSTGDKSYHIGKYAMKNMQIIQYINILSLISRDERNTGCILHLLYILMIRRSILHKWLIWMTKYLLFNECSQFVICSSRHFNSIHQMTQWVVSHCDEWLNLEWLWW